MHKVIIAGTRDFDDYLWAEMKIEKILKNFNSAEVEIVSGHATGADAIGERYAKLHNMSCKIFPADWQKYGKAAGPIRNQQMAEYAKDDGYLIAFWDDKSPGTYNMIQQAQKYGLKIRIIHYEKEGGIVKWD